MSLRLKTDSFTFPDVAWQAVKRRGALKEKGLALSEAEGPLTEGEGPDFFKIIRSVENPAAFPHNFSGTRLGFLPVFRHNLFPVL